MYSPNTDVTGLIRFLHFIYTVTVNFLKKFLKKEHSCTRYVWVLEGDTGKVLEGWPVKLPSEVLATVLVTKLVPGESSASDIVSTCIASTLYCKWCSVLNKAALSKNLFHLSHIT